LGIPLRVPPGKRKSNERSQVVATSGETAVKGMSGFSQSKPRRADSRGGEDDRHRSGDSSGKESKKTEVLKGKKEKSSRDFRAKPQPDKGSAGQWSRPLDTGQLKKNKFRKRKNGSHWQGKPGKKKKNKNHIKRKIDQKECVMKKR